MSAVASLGLLVSACESPPSVSLPPNAVVRLQGQVTDPSGAGVAGAEVTATFHETTSCASPELAASSFSTRSDGSIDALPPGLDVTEDFLPRDVCMGLRVEPPPDRPDLAATDTAGIAVTLRDQFGDEPPDEVEVDVILPEAGGS